MEKFDLFGPETEQTQQIAQSNGDKRSYAVHIDISRKTPPTRSLRTIDKLIYNMNLC